jgi:hypothetical protein
MKIVYGVNEHDEPVTVQIIFRPDQSAEIYVDLGSGDMETLARVYVSSDEADKLRSL